VAIIWLRFLLVFLSLSRQLLAWYLKLISDDFHWLHGGELFLKSCQLCLLTPEGTFPFLQEVSTGPHPEPDPSSPCYPTLFKSHCNITHLATFWFSCWSLSFRRFCRYPTWHSIMHGEGYKLSHYAVLSYLMSHCPSWVQIFSVPCPQTSSVCIPPLLLRDQVSHPSNVHVSTQTRRHKRF
jgi:hypothetical protein